MSWEEAQAAPYLPPHILAMLKQEHQRIIAGGFQQSDLAAHSRWEEQIFQQYCPTQMCQQVLADHSAWEHGRLHSRGA